ncbi:septum formation family protein [Nitriliruptor alkaliphilus]|uniref:septum formation family protein n=1 Tax=Nitriliruptor alkaliphilus TaxID=427918 RepID=UPI000698743E|nr:septum formation family protein [Nitriliruptor alkaliphilus]
MPPPRKRWVLPVVLGSVALVLVLGGLAVVAIVALFSGGDYVRTVGPQGDLTEVTLAVGDCADVDPFEVTRLDEATVVPCTGRHLLEVAAREPLVGPTGVLQARSPLDGPVLDVSERFCIAQFEAYVDVAYMDSDLDVLTLLPDEGRWAAGEREVICLVVPWWDDDLFGPARGSQR